MQDPMSLQVWHDNGPSEALGMDPNFCSPLLAMVSATYPARQKQLTFSTCWEDIMKIVSNGNPSQERCEGKSLCKGMGFQLYQKETGILDTTDSTDEL